MTPKRSLPLADPAARRPTVDAIRRRLGGRAASGPGVGELVTLAPDARAGARLGVVLFARGDELDVWVEHGVVRRVLRWTTSPASDVAAGALAAVADDARAFAALEEGQRVGFATDGDAAARGDGTLIEKCRYGALVLRDDGVIMGVGFRRVWAEGATRTQN